ncbi:histidine kinase [Actinomadura adrarensis]|uniref:Histidine kinase n=1 Tax=Actinomadura adrarensis TaxID=1819600 RepID=A0ABW3CUZ1_9ACTN
MTVLACYAVNILVNALWGPSRRHLEVFLLCLAGILALQIVSSIRGSQAWPAGLRVAFLAVQGGLTYLPLLWIPPWGSMAGFLAGSVLLLVPGRLRWGLYATVGASILPAALIWDTSPPIVLWLIESSLVTGLVIYGVSSLAAMVGAAHAARGELARMAVVREQLRAERELSDVLGRGLAGMIRKFRLVSDLLDGRVDAQRAKEQLAEAKDLARQAIADVRRVAQGYRRPVLRTETETVTAKLESVGIDTTVEVPDGPLPRGIDALLAIALREIAANLLQLDPGGRCRITIAEANGHVSMHVDVQGVHDAATAGPLELDRLPELLSTADATLTIEPVDRGVLRLAVTVPGEATTLVAGNDFVPSEPARSPDGQAEQWTPRTAVVVMTVVLGAYALVTAVFVVSGGVTGRRLAAFVLCFAVVSLLQLANSAHVTAPWPTPLKMLVLAVQAVATYVPLTFLGQQWAAMAGFLAGSVLLLLPASWRWGLSGMVVGSIGVFLWLGGMPTISIFSGIVFTLLSALIVFGLSSLQTLVAEVRAAHGPLVRAAVAQERLRMARDLHDLLGYSLSAISVKTELAYRLLPGFPVRARQEATELLTVTRQALADVHHAAGGNPEVSLEEEAESASSTLAASGIEGTVDVACGELREDVETALAIVLREATANILRHSKARVYVIRLTREPGIVRLYVANDGAGTEDRNQPEPGGAGLQNIEARLRALDGELAVELDADGWFRLTGVVPV